MPVGKGATSLKKKMVKESLVPAIGFKKIRFLTRLGQGATVIQLGSLTAPSISEAPNYSAPNVSDLMATNLLFFPDNLELVSSLRGRLMRNLSYDISGASTIVLRYSAVDGEIIEGIIDHTPKSGNNLVDGRPFVVSDVLLAGQTDFNVGDPFTVNSNPLQQHGDRLVFIDNQLAYRKVGNVPTAEGDYFEVAASGGLGTIYRFNADLTQDRNITVVSIGALVERPNGSMMAVIESLQGQIDAIIPTLAALAGVPTTNFQAQPGNVDLKAFGDRVLQAEQDIDVLQDPPTGAVRKIEFTERKDNPTLTTTSAIFSNNTLPQITQGVEIFNVNFAPIKLGNKLLIEVQVVGSENNNSADELSACLFVNGGTNAIAAGTDAGWQSGGPTMNHNDGNVTFSTVVTATQALMNFSVRASFNANDTWILNRHHSFGGTQYNLGGTIVSFIKITEIEV